MESRSVISQKQTLRNFWDSDMKTGWVSQTSLSKSRFYLFYAGTTPIPRHLSNVNASKDLKHKYFLLRRVQAKPEFGWAKRKGKASKQ